MSGKRFSAQLRHVPTMMHSRTDLQILQGLFVKRFRKFENSTTSVYPQRTKKTSKTSPIGLVVGNFALNQERLKGQFDHLPVN